MPRKNSPQNNALLSQRIFILCTKFDSDRRHGIIARTVIP
jgi:hypothetical protein